MGFKEKESLLQAFHSRFEGALKPGQFTLEKYP